MSKGLIFKILSRGVVLSLFCSAFLWRCANIVTPEGGPKDTLPPVVVGMSPENYAVNFKDKKIYIQFNEYVQLKEQQKEFFTSPMMKKKPLLSIRGKGIVIQIKDTLRDNTTYALNFGSAIADNNEGNALNSARFVFSTGAQIDSMFFSGYVEDGYKADSASKSFIYFFQADSVPDPAQMDSTMFNHKPAVIARAEMNGVFFAQNLKPVPYRIYAFQDANGNQIYEAGTDKVGFAEGLYDPSQMPDFSIWYDSTRRYVVAEPQINLRLFKDKGKKRQSLKNSERPLQNKAMLTFGAPNPRIESLTFDSIPSERVIVESLRRGGDSLALWFNMPPESLPDTIKGELAFYKPDSLDNMVLTKEKLRLAWRFIETKEQEREREKREKERKKAEASGEVVEQEANPFSFKLATSGEVMPEKGQVAEFEYPLVRVDSSRIALYEVNKGRGGETINPVRHTWERDSLTMLKWRLKADWRQGKEYRLLVPDSVFVDVRGFANDSLTASYTVAKPESYATLLFTVTDKGDGSKYVVQLLRGNTVEKELRGVTGGNYKMEYVPVGDLQIRIIEDVNANGEWDTGDLVARRQPERVALYVNDKGENTFTTRANWEMEITLDMPQIFAPRTMENMNKMLLDAERQRLKKESDERNKSRSKTPVQNKAADGHQH